MQDQSLFQQPEHSPETNAHGETKTLDQASLSAFASLQALLQTELQATTGLDRFMLTTGTLPQLNGLQAGKHKLLPSLFSALRSFGQVIFINNPITGIFLLVGLALQSPWYSLLAVIGTTSAQVASYWLGCDKGAQRQGIYGFNGALVGCAIAAFANLDGSDPWLFWLLLAALGGGLTTLLIHGWSLWLLDRTGLPPLTLPFCLVTWLLLLLATLLGPSILPLAATSLDQSSTTSPLTLLSGLSSGFGQIFLCSNPLTGFLVLVAMALASPLAALAGLLGGIVGMLTGMLIGVTPDSLAQGLWSYNGILVTIAIGGTFYAPTLRSLAIGLIGAAVTTLLSALILAGLPIQWPILTAPFVLTTWILQLVVRQTLPALIPVGLHSIVTPEEHRQRFVVAREVMLTFRNQLKNTLTGLPRPSLSLGLPPESLTPIHMIFARFDLDNSGDLSLEELCAAMAQSLETTSDNQTQKTSLEKIFKAMDLNGDNSIDLNEFTELVLRWQRLQQQHERLIAYIMPVDRNSNDSLSSTELNHLLANLSLAPLSIEEKHYLFLNSSAELTWSEFVDTLLLT